MPKISTYYVWASKHMKFRVRAYNTVNARKNAWSMMIKGYRYGWTREDFLKNATVTKID